MHLTDDQLNEYLDNESSERAQIEAHLASCDECAARLSALQTLFAEIESLPELELTHDIAARLITARSLSVKLPPSLTLTVTLQAISALIAILIAAPYASGLLTHYSPDLSVSSWMNIMIGLQSNFVMWFQSFQTFRLPEIPTEVLTLPKELTPEMIAIGVFSIFFVWVTGNWWLLRKRPNSPV